MTDITTMTDIATFAYQLAEDLNKAERGRAIKYNLTQTPRPRAREALEDAIKAVRGEVTAEDRVCLDLVDPIQLIQVLCVNTVGLIGDMSVEMFKAPIGVGYD